METMEVTVGINTFYVLADLAGVLIIGLLAQGVVVKAVRLLGSER